MSLLTKEFYKAIDEINSTTFIRPKTFMMPSDEWDEKMHRYWKEVKDAAERHLLRRGGKTAEEQKVKDLFLAKLDWIAMPHGDAHYQVPMPLLTRSTIVTIVQMLSNVERAVIEVSFAHHWLAGRVFVHHQPVEFVRLADDGNDITYPRQSSMLDWRRRLKIWIRQSSSLDWRVV